LAIHDKLAFNSERNSKLTPNTMNPTAPSLRIPRSIPQVPGLFSEFLSKHFPKAFIWGINTVVDNSGQFVYKVELSDTRNLYHLMFNLDGELIERNEEIML
jgi:hypothetical protein